MSRNTRQGYGSPRVCDRTRTYEGYSYRGRKRREKTRSSSDSLRNSPVIGGYRARNEKKQGPMLEDAGLRKFDRKYVERCYAMVLKHVVQRGFVRSASFVLLFFLIIADDFPSPYGLEKWCLRSTEMNQTLCFFCLSFNRVSDPLSHRESLCQSGVLFISTCLESKEVESA